MLKQPKRNMNKLRFDTEHRYLPRETKASVRTLADNTRGGDANLLLLGGNTVTSDVSGGSNDPGPDPTPEPTPTPTDPDDPDDPTDKPSDPATPPASGGGSGSGGKDEQDPEGDLADTGTGTPVGLIAGLAAALAAVGGGLVWWKRRRTADQE
ncbi:LPXTG cell wall anchor domain-containing protein [Streptomyces tailanensis]|uniref:LPXTG cell wall anchor domain-containing protein n=1 Tax=Streptomyces tailanensis TaxID=2569858 RepID=UPI00122E6ED3|nr:LPXTG cell wall anchor domain-containing protein [Streptomyces tailanensis]